jgi:hypothetical protein
MQANKLAAREAEWQAKLEADRLNLQAGREHGILMAGGMPYLQARVAGGADRYAEERDMILAEEVRRKAEEERRKAEEERRGRTEKRTDESHELGIKLAKQDLASRGLTYTQRREKYKRRLNSGFFSAELAADIAGLGAREAKDILSKWIDTSDEQRAAQKIKWQMGVLALQRETSDLGTSKFRQEIAKRAAQEHGSEEAVQQRLGARKVAIETAKKQLREMATGVGGMSPEQFVSYADNLRQIMIAETDLKRHELEHAGEYIDLSHQVRMGKMLQQKKRLNNEELQELKRKTDLAAAKLQYNKMKTQLDSMTNPLAKNAVEAQEIDRQAESFSEKIMEVIDAHDWLPDFVEHSQDRADKPESTLSEALQSMRATVMKKGHPLNPEGSKKGGDRAMKMILSVLSKDENYRAALEGIGMHSPGSLKRIRKQWRIATGGGAHEPKTYDITSPWAQRFLKGGHINFSRTGTFTQFIPKFGQPFDKYDRRKFAKRVHDYRAQDHIITREWVEKTWEDVTGRDFGMSMGVGKVDTLGVMDKLLRILNEKRLVTDISGTR